MKKSFITLCAVAALAGPAYSQGVAVDTFESYTSQAELDAVWTDQEPGSTLEITTGDGAEGSNNFVQFTAAGDRRYHSGTISVTPTDAEPATLECWYRQPLATSLNREYVNINSSLTGANVVAIGNYNSAATPGFFGRVNGGDGPSWVTIGGTRLENTWQHLQAVIKSRDVDFYVDGVLTHTASRVTSDHPEYTVLFMGSNLTGVTTVDFDNVGFTVSASVGDWDLY